MTPKSQSEFELLFQANTSIHYKTSMAKRKWQTELVAVFTCGWLSRKTVVTWNCPFSRHRQRAQQPSAACMATAAKQQNWEMTGPFYYFLHPLCLWKKGSKKPHSFKAVLLLTAWLWWTRGLCGLPHGNQKCNAKAETLFFAISLKVKNCLEYILWREVLQTAGLFSCWQSMLNWSISHFWLFP